jgi:hypothetical protein
MERDQGFFIFGVILSSIWLFAFIKETFTRIKATEVFDNQIEIKDIIKITFKSYRFGYLLKGRIDLKIISSGKFGVHQMNYQIQNLKNY